MTTTEKRVLTAAKHGNGYVTLSPRNLDKMMGVQDNVSHEQSRQILEFAYNNPTRAYRPKIGVLRLFEDVDPTSCFQLPQDSVKSVIKSVAAVAFKDYGLDRVGYVDIADAAASDERTQTTLMSIKNLGLKALSASNSNNSGIALVTVASGHLLEEPESQRAAEMYDALSELPTSHYRVAIFGEADMPIASARA